MRERTHAGGFLVMVVRYAAEPVFFGVEFIGRPIPPGVGQGHLGEREAVEAADAGLRNDGHDCAALGCDAWRIPDRPLID